MIEIQITMGEALDRLSILDIKRQRISDATKKDRAEAQYQALAEQLVQSVGQFVNDPRVTPITRALGRINASLWDLEDEIRSLIDKRSTTATKLARVATEIAQHNDRRFQLKQELDQHFNDDADGEVKELPNYGT